MFSDALADATITIGATTTVTGADGTDTLTNTEVLSFSDLNLDLSGASPVAFVDLARLNATQGFRLDGVDQGDNSGLAVAGAGDINGDGYDDLIVGAGFADVGTQVNAGESYVIFGTDFSRVVDDDGTTGDDLLTGGAGDQILVGGLGNDILDGGADDDVLVGGAGDDTITFDATDTQRVDGGSGADTLALGGDLDLTTYNDTAHYNVVEGFEIIALNTIGNVNLTLELRDLLNLSDTSNTLRVDDNAGDAVITGDTGWGAGAAGTGG
ncbi:MAG: hypothetical protein EXQ94_05540 [Alphaproteobacteria bacterium]|nr:hypothetical protein [Alphaproteobacteria bacterium]